jgi:hypothetical protein
VFLAQISCLNYAYEWANWKWLNSLSMRRQMWNLLIIKIAWHVNILVYKVDIFFFFKYVQTVTWCCKLQIHQISIMRKHFGFISNSCYYCTCCSHFGPHGNQYHWVVFYMYFLLKLWFRSAFNIVCTWTTLYNIVDVGNNERWNVQVLNGAPNAFCSG